MKARLRRAGDAIAIWFALERTVRPEIRATDNNSTQCACCCRHFLARDRDRPAICKSGLHDSANETVRVGSTGLESKTPANQGVTDRTFVVTRVLRSGAPPLSSLICCVILASND